ncbi:hypothetical protein SESBI_48843 [Sesbania bispinosa]|nr:hypothetical protein SESBI_48843 [Sesbania bispinosa]
MSFLLKDQRQLMWKKLRKNKKYFEYIFAMFRMSKSQITTDIKDTVDKAEMFIQSVLYPRNVSPHLQVLTNQIPQQNKMCLQEQQVANSPQSLNSMSPEALTTSVGEIRELVHLYDVSQLIGGPPKIEEQKNMLQLIYGPPKMEEQQSQPSLTLEGRVTPPKSEIGRKMSRNITAMSFDAGEPNLKSFTSKVQHPRVEENTAVLEEIKEINNVLIDTEVVIGEKDSIGSIAGGYAKYSEGLVVKFMFNALTINQDLISHYGTDKKSIINPLWLLVPTSYPFSSPVILDDKPWEAGSEELKDLTLKAKAKLKFSFRSMNQPWSLKDIALSWDVVPEKQSLSMHMPLVEERLPQNMEGERHVKMLMCICVVYSYRKSQ